MSDVAELVAIQTELVVQRLKDTVVFGVKYEDNTGARSSELAVSLPRKNVEELYQQLGDWLAATQ